MERKRPAPTRRHFVNRAMPAALFADLELPKEPLRQGSYFAAAPANLPSPSPEMHVLNRLTFGPRHGELERVENIGIDAFIEEQLDPDTINDSAVESFIKKKYPKLRKDPPELLAKDSYEQSEQLIYATIYRALFSKRQLYERMVEFWSDHFSIYIWDDWPSYIKYADDRDVIRPNAMGTFPDLLRASTKSAAMLTYLDNESNTRWGPNENYARELLELHTLGVDNGYTQEDVEELARALTGWGVAWPKGNRGNFKYEKDLHDRRKKEVLGMKLPKGGGIKEGERVVDMLAEHPNTAEFIATKLVLRFVADLPPEKLVNKVKQTFLDTGGDIKSMLRTIFDSSEFTNSADQKFKRPIDFVVSALRSAGAKFDKNRDDALYWALYQLAQAPFHWSPPNGFPDVGGAWANTNGMLGRWNFVSHIVNGYHWGIRDFLEDMVDNSGAKTAEQYVDFFVERMLSRSIRSSDRDAMISYFSNGKGAKKKLKGWALRQSTVGLVTLLFASPYFQVR